MKRIRRILHPKELFGVKSQGHGACEPAGARPVTPASALTQ